MRPSARILDDLQLHQPTAKGVGKPGEPSLGLLLHGHPRLTIGDDPFDMASDLIGDPLGHFAEP